MIRQHTPIIDTENHRKLPKKQGAKFLLAPCFFAQFHTFSWEQRKCSDFIKLVGGATPSKANKDYWNGDIVWLSSQEIKEDSLAKSANIPIISVHGLRHTHASLLLFDGVSIASVAQRLGHSSINTTQKTYLHIIRELENKDIDLIMKSISSLLD